MGTRNLLMVLAVSLHQLLAAQSPNKIAGPLGVYHVVAGYTYSDTTGNDSIPIDEEFRMGEICIPSQDSDHAIAFLPEIDSCIRWNANRVFAIVQPPTEGGVNNQPGDTSLYFPYPVSKGPGLIQAAERFSRLSTLYGPFCGAILDDFDNDTATTRQVRDALYGKTLDANGNVDENSEAITPENKLYGVIYNTGPDPVVISLLDGVSYWYDQGQNCCYMNLDSDISTLRINYPGKEIFIGIFLKNSFLGYTTPASVQYMLQHAFDQYDDGNINGVTLSGYNLSMDWTSLSQWNAFALPHWLDSVYYPFLGQAQGRVTACYADTGALPGAFVRVFCTGRVSGDTLMRSRQMADANGQFQCGLWAGNRNTDSTYYWAIAEKAGYISDTVGFWIKQGDTTDIPNISLCPDVYANRSENSMFLFPNPSTGQFTVEANIVAETNATMIIYNMQGQKVFESAGPEPVLTVNISWLEDGLYLVEVTTANKKEHLQQMMVIQH